MRYGILLLTILLVSGCATLNPLNNTDQSTVKNNNTQAWQQRLKKLNSATVWRLVGRGALNYEEENWPFALSWVQTGQLYAMNFKNPLTGSLAARLEKEKNNIVNLKTSDGKSYSGNNAENLLKDNLGISLPVQGLHYWIRGLSSPDYSIETVNVDGQGRPSEIKQAGWLIKYQRYENEAFDALPQKMRMVRDGVSLKMIIKKWQIRYH